MTEKEIIRISNEKAVLRCRCDKCNKMVTIRTDDEDMIANIMDGSAMFKCNFCSKYSRINIIEQ